MGFAGRSFKVEIVLSDGSMCVVTGVDRLQDRERVLRLYRKLSAYGPDLEHLGSWPFEAIQSWKVVE